MFELWQKVERLLGHRSAVPDGANGAGAGSEESPRADADAPPNSLGRDEASSLRTGGASARERLAGIAPSKKQVSLASFVTLGTADVVGLSHEVTRLSQTIGVLGVGGAAGLILTSIHDLRSSKPATEKWDAASNLVWGQQGLLKLSSSSLALKTAVGLGVAGGLIQTTVGVVRMRQGYRKGDRATVKLGMLDVGSGLLWLGWDLLALEAPLFVASYVLVRVTREAYANRDSVAELAERARGRAARAYSRCASGVEAILDDTARDVERALLLLARAPSVEAEAGAAGESDGDAEPAATGIEISPARLAARARRRLLPIVRSLGAS